MTWILIQTNDADTARMIWTRLAMYFGRDHVSEPLPGNPSGYVMALRRFNDDTRTTARSILTAYYEGGMCYWPSLLPGTIFSEVEV